MQSKGSFDGDAEYIPHTRSLQSPVMFHERIGRLDMLHRARQHSLDVLMHFCKGAVASRLDTPWRVIKI
jgi:hypothetical protein